MMTTISSALGPRAQVKFLAWGGSIVFASGGNLSLPSSPLTLPQNALAEFESADSTVGWALVSKTA